MKDIRTVGDLRQLIARLDAEGVADDLPLTRPTGLGDTWRVGFDEIVEVDLVTFQKFGTTMTVPSDHWMSEWGRDKSTPFLGLAFK